MRRTREDYEKLERKGLPGIDSSIDALGRVCSRYRLVPPSAPSPNSSDAFVLGYGPGSCHRSGARDQALLFCCTHSPKPTGLRLMTTSRSRVITPDWSMDLKRPKCFLVRNVGVFAPCTSHTWSQLLPKTLPSFGTVLKGRKQKP